MLFAKAPVKGLVKTRLVPAIPAEFALDLHRAFVKDMISRFRYLEATDFELHTNMTTDEWADIGVAHKLQIPGDLGLKMIHALDAALQSGYRRALVLGGDAPTLPVGHVRTLLASERDVALGPAQDGGFYAISAGRVCHRMFDGVPWSQSDTMARTMEAIDRSGLSVELGPPWFDVDEPGDLRRLLADNDLPANTAACLKRFSEVKINTG